VVKITRKSDWPIIRLPLQKLFK